MSNSGTLTIELIDAGRLMPNALRKRGMLTAKLKDVGTLNVQACPEEDKKQFIYEDILKYNMQITGLTETHISQKEILAVVTARPRYRVY